MTLHELVGREHHRARRLLLLAGAASAVAAVALALVVGVAVLGGGRWIALPALLPLLVWLAVLALVAFIAIRIRMHVRHDVALAMVASAVERERGLRAGSLRGALEVADANALGHANALRVSQQLETSGSSTLAPALRRRFRRQAATWAGVATATLLVLVAAASARPDGALAIVHPLAAYDGSLVPALRLDAPAVVRRGERVPVTVLARGRRTVTLQYRATGRPAITTELPVERDSARLTIGPLEAAMTLVASDGRTSSDTTSIRVVERPFLGDVRLRAYFPAYLGREPETLPVGEPVRVPRGTIIDVAGHASTPLRSVHLRRGSETIVLSTVDRSFDARITATDRITGRWEWDATGTRETIADLPAALEIDVRPDSLPTVLILMPPSDTLVAAATRILVRGAARDDHGLADVMLRSWRVAGGRDASPEMLQRLSTEVTPEWSGNVVLDLAARGVEAGDALHVRLEATDNSPWRQRGESRELVIRVPSASERRELAREAGDSAVAAASSMVAKQRDLERRTGEAAKSRGQRQQAGTPQAQASARSSATMPYEATQQARALLREQQALAEKVKALQEHAAELEKQLKLAGALDTALARQLAETQSLLKDALTPELAEQMKALEKALQQMSPEQLRTSLSDLQKQQQRMREQLEKSVEMLRRAALEGSMQTLRDEAKELAGQERAFADSARQSREGVPKERAGELAERSRDLSRDVSKLSERLAKENAKAGTERSRSASAHADRAASQLEKASSPQGGSPSEQRNAANRGAQQAADEMEQAAQELAESRKEQIQEWKDELTGQLDKSIQEMLQLAQEQYDLEKDASQQGVDQSGLRSRQSAVQQGVDKAADRLGAAGKKSSLLGSGSQRAMNEAKKEVAEASEAVAESRGDQRSMASEMREAGDALNRAAASLVKDRERAANAASASGFTEMLQRMQELAQQQGALGAQGQSLLQIPGGDVNGEVRSSVRTMARRQRALAQQLEEMSDGEAGGRAAELAREARQIARNLESGAVDPATVARQQQLFKRLLDAGRTMEQNDRDDTGQRESRSATEGERFTPPGTTAGDRAADKFRMPEWNDLRGLSAEERRAVLEYFRRINAEKP